MSQGIVKETSPLFKNLADVCAGGCTLSVMQLQKLWADGNRDLVKSYVQKHSRGSAMQVWIMRTRDTELILAYLMSHKNSGLFEDAEELLMSLNNKLRRTYLEHWYLRRSSLLLLFAQKEFVLLRRYVKKHPEECFSRTLLFLMFETGDEKLIRQYAYTHPSIFEEERYAQKLKEFGLMHPVSAVH